MAVHLWDGNNHARITFESDTSGLATRRLFNDGYYATEPTIYVFDGKNSKAKRRELYPEYKAQRKPAPSNFYIVMEFFKELLMHTNCVQVEVPGYEADDVIAQLVRNSPTTQFVIHSTDADYCVLASNLVTVQGATMGEIPAEDVRLFKTICFDKSDNIKGIPGVGEVYWKRLSIAQKTMLRRWLSEDGMLDISGLPLPPKSIDWMVLPKNFQLLQAYWKIVDFMPVSKELISQGMKVGTPDLALATDKLKEIFQ